MLKERQVYVIKVWRDAENHLCLELRAPNSERPYYFANLLELKAFFESQNPPKPSKNGLK